MPFENSYLAESVGYASGHSRGFNVGEEAGYISGRTDGWNAAVIQWRQQADEWKREAENLKAQRNQAKADCALNYQIGMGFKAEIEQLKHRIAELEQTQGLQQEQAHSVRADYETMFKAFLGMIAIAGPALKRIAKLPFEEKHDFFFEYVDAAIKVQSREYINANSFPVNQPLIKQYFPLAKQVMYQINNQIKEHEARIKLEATYGDLPPPADVFAKPPPVDNS
jgi:chromosome segregation ATPase